MGTAEAVSARQKATPGPWKHVAVQGGWDGVADSYGAMICTLYLNVPANADLIAAAPDLLAALKDVLRIAKAATDGSGVGYANRIAAAEAAIAAAEGN